MIEGLPEGEIVSALLRLASITRCLFYGCAAFHLEYPLPYTSSIFSHARRLFRACALAVNFRNQPRKAYCQRGQLHPFHKFCKFHLQHFDQPQQHLKGRIAYATLDLGNIGAVNVCAERQLFLGNTKHYALLSHTFSQHLPRGKKVIIHTFQG